MYVVVFVLTLDEIEAIQVIMPQVKKEWADKCQDWCETQHSCNAEITKHSIK